MAAMANRLLGVSVQLGLLFADPASASIQPTDHVVGVATKSIANAERGHQPGFHNIRHSKPAEPEPISPEQLRRGLELSSFRLATLNKTSAQTLQAQFAFHTLRYAIAMNNYFRVRHANEDCSEQVAAWNTALNAAKRANIKSYLRDLPPDCPLR